MKHPGLILINLLALIILTSGLYACTPKFWATVSDDILINQIGYPTEARKKALLRMDTDSFELRDRRGDIVFQGPVSAPAFWVLSGDSVRLADFSGFTEAGEYRLCVQDTLCSYPFRIGDALYGNLADAALKSYYYARCGVALKEEHAGKWHRAAGHPDTEVLIHASAADEKRPEGSTISAPGGWYDAGDYGKYTVNSSITTWTLLQSLAWNTTFHRAQNLRIPESGNELPDILDEALVNLKWMMSMQDPNDGGVYHKLTTKKFDDFIMPHETHKQRYVVQKSTAATLDFAATMAAAARILRGYQLEDLADDMGKRAKAAWAWAEQRPDIIYEQPLDISTGAYGDATLQDEWFWAAAELYLLTGDAKYQEIISKNYQEIVTPKWNVVHSLGVISVLGADQRKEFAQMETDFFNYVDRLLEKAKACPYLISTDKFAWGSNSDVANDGVLKLIAYRLSGEQQYLASAQNDLDYLLGRNTTGYSFVTGYGDKTPLHPHHRIMAADGVEEPIPGYLAGGPNLSVMTDCDPGEVVRSKFPAASYTDTQCSYSTNETAINWNAPLVFLVSGLAAMSP